jgi:hypothetical protein
MPGGGGGSVGGGGGSVGGGGGGATVCVRGGVLVCAGCEVGFAVSVVVCDGSAGGEYVPEDELES